MAVFSVFREVGGSLPRYSRIPGVPILEDCLCLDFGRFGQLEALAVFAGEEAIGGLVRRKLSLGVDRELFAELQFCLIEVDFVVLDILFETFERVIHVSVV